MRRTTDYTWHLSEIMARNGMHNSTALTPLLADRGITLSPAQIWRLVTQRPERLSLPLLAALCDIFHCTPAELVTVTAADETVRRTGTTNNTIDLNSVGSKTRPRRAQIVTND